MIVAYVWNRCTVLRHEKRWDCCCDFAWFSVRFRSAKCIAIAHSDVYQRFSHPSKLRVSSEVMAGLMIHRVDPVYPPEAKKKHVKGNVLLQVLINKQGHVADAVVVKGDPTLAGATVEAVKQWRFQPYLLNGEPVDVETVEVLSFGK